MVFNFHVEQESPPALTRKRHTDRGVASPRYAVPVVGVVPTLVGGYLPWWGGTYPGWGVPTLVGVPTLGGYLPGWGGTYPAQKVGVPTLAGGGGVPTYLGRYPPHPDLGRVGTPPPTQKVGTPPTQT